MSFFAKVGKVAIYSTKKGPKVSVPKAKSTPKKKRKK
jgi:hypothetical protein